MSILALAIRKARSARSRALYRVRRPTTRKLVSRLLAFAKPAYHGTICATESDALHRDGFVVTDGLWTRDDLVSLRTQLEQRECYDPWSEALGSFALGDSPQESNNVRIKDVESIPEAIAIANDPKILSIVSRYIGCKPTIDEVVAWWSLPGREAPREEQFFHRDNDSIRFLKLFVYLTDVDENSGPHVFIAGSHERPEMVDAGGRRFTDDDVAQAGLLKHAHHFTGPFGTAFLEDTFGLHKGQMPIDKPRLILQVRYTLLPSIFARSKLHRAKTAGYDPYMNRVLAGR